MVAPSSHFHIITSHFAVWGGVQPGDHAGDRRGALHLREYLPGDLQDRPTFLTPPQEYNQPHKPVRVFTYLIGREISDLDAAKWMACENKGDHTDNPA